MSTGKVTRSSSTSGKSQANEGGVSAVGGIISVSEVAGIVQRAVESAVKEIQQLLQDRFDELQNKLMVLENRVLDLEEQKADARSPSEQATDDSHAQLSAELNAVRSETRESLLQSNDNEQYSRRNNVRLCGVGRVEGEDCRVTAVKFIKNTLRVAVNEADIEVAHMTAGSAQSSTAQQKRPTMLVRFCRRDQRDLVIRSRKILKGSHFAVTEDLTNLNIKTMNRLKNSEHVRTTWSWNGKIFAILTNGNKVTVRPFQPIAELLAI